MTSNRQQISILFTLILVLGFISGSIFVGNLPNKWPGKYFFERFNTHLGLDLQGGAHLLYEADTSEVTTEEAESAIEGVRDVIERRVNSLGVSEPIVQTAQVGDKLRIIVELAGVFDVNDAIAQIGETPLLEFKTEALAPPAEELSAEELASRKEFNELQLAKAKDTLRRIAFTETANFAEVAIEVSEDPGSSENGGDLGFLRREQLVQPFASELFDVLIEDGAMSNSPIETDFGYHIIQRIEARDVEVETNEGTETVREIRARHVLLQKQLLEGVVPEYDPWQSTDLGGKQLARAQVLFDQYSGSAQVGLEFDDEGDKLFEEITEVNIGKRIAIFLDGSLISAPEVRDKISGGSAVISGNFTIPEAKDLVNRLNSGALPVPINLVSQQTVGPTLGEISVQKSLVAGLVGFALVALFMLFIYRVSGLLAVVALIFYTSIVFTLFKLIPVTLTLAGIAGFLLSIGMAVDANVLIFERLREELRSGQSFHNAVREGFARAWNSIRDSNVSTLLTCLILAWFGTSVIKGFAITLGVGVLVSMFSAIVITRLFVEVVGRVPWLSKKKWLWGG